MVADIRFVMREIQSPQYGEGVCEMVQVLQVRYWADIDSPHRFMGDWQDVRIENA